MPQRPLSLVSTCAGFNPTAPAISGNDRWEVLRIARAVKEQSGGRFTGFDILPCNALDPAECREYVDMAGAIKDLGYSDLSTFIFTPNGFSLADASSRKDGSALVLAQVRLGASVAAKVIAGPIFEDWVTGIGKGDDGYGCEDFARFRENVIEPVAAELALISEAADGLGVEQLLGEYLCPREYRRVTNPARAGEICRRANELKKKGPPWGVLHDTSHLFETALRYGWNMDAIRLKIKQSNMGLPRPTRRHLSAYMTRGEIGPDSAMPVRELVDAIDDGDTLGKLGLELFPWWDTGVRTAIRGFGIPTFAREDMVGAIVRSANYFDSI